MAIYEESQELIGMAQALIDRYDFARHIDVNTVLFLDESETQPKALAKTFSLHDHPMQFFATNEFCIVFYRQNIDYFTREQLQILMAHELMHIPALGHKLIDHPVKDFPSILMIDINWAGMNVEVPDLLAPGIAVIDEGDLHGGI